MTDYRCKQIAKQKIKRIQNTIKLELFANPDILLGLTKNKKNKILIGFALETENEEKNAKMKMTNKNLDMIIMNNPFIKGAGFSADTNKVTIYNKSGQKTNLPLMKKSEVAVKILDEIEKLL